MWEAGVDFVTVNNGAVELSVAVSGSGPLIVCAHGFPELWYSWRHQIAHLAALGFRLAALDVRGYGRSSKPTEIEAYTLRNLASDVVAVIDHIGDGPAILFGHDWGASIVWHTALLHPEKIRAVAGLSVPFFPAEARPSSRWRAPPTKGVSSIRFTSSRRVSRRRSWRQMSRAHCAGCISRRPVPRP